MKEMDKNEGQWKKLFKGMVGVQRVADLLCFLVIISMCYLCYYKGDLSCFSSVALALVCFVIHFGMHYLDYYDGNLYWDDVSQNGYLYHKTHDIKRKKNSFVLAAKPACNWVLECMAFTVTALLVFDIWYGINRPFLCIVVWLYMLIMQIGARYQEGKRNLNFDKKQGKFWRGGKVDSVWDFTKCSDVVALEKIKDFFIVQNDGYYDLEMCLDDSRKIKLISNVDEEYLKKIEGELREFLGCGDKSSSIC